MKRMIALLLVLLVCLNAGCAFIPIQREPQAQTQQTTQPTVWTPSTEQTQQPTEETQPPQPVYYPVSAQDQYCEVYSTPYDVSVKYCVHIPTLYWNGQECSLLREQIYFDHMQQIEPTGLNGQPVFSAGYSLGQANGVASVVTRFVCQDYDYWKYSLFHVDLSNGQEANDDQILEAFGYTRDRFYSEVRAIAQAMFRNTYDNSGSFAASDAYMEMLTRQVSDEIIHQARPFVDENGRLCALYTSITPAGAGQYPACMCLQSQDYMVNINGATCNVH